MPTDTTDQQITMPTGPDAADNPVAFVNEVADIEPRLVRRYATEADRTARMLSLTENAVSTLAAEDRAEIYNGTNHISLFSRGIFANRFRTTDATAINNSTVLVSDAVLVAALPTAGRFQFELVMFYDSSTAADFKVAFTIPAAAVIRWGGVGPSTTVSAGVGTGQFSVAIGSGTSIPYGGSGVGTANTMMMIAKGNVLMGGTAGNLQVQYAQQTADPTDTVVRAHSRLHVWRVE